MERRTPVIIAIALGALLLQQLRSCAPGASRVALPDISADPVQEELDPPLVVDVVRGGKPFHIRQTHHYVAVGEVLSAESYDLTWTNDFFDVDVGIIWGPFREEIEQAVHFNQGGRWLFWVSPGPVSDDLRARITRSVGNEHLIPAEGRDNLARAIRGTRKGERVRIEGMLVDIEDDAGNVLTRSSRSRDDTGAGACEVVYVTRFQRDRRSWR